MQATGKEFYLQAAQHMMAGLIRHTRVPGGFASIRSVRSMEKEDHMHSFFLAETCKYLYLMANDTFLQVPTWYLLSQDSLQQLTAPQFQTGQDVRVTKLHSGMQWEHQMGCLW